MSSATLDRPADQLANDEPPPAEEPRFVRWARPPSRFIWRTRLAAICFLLTALMFLQDPGRIAADTKLDLANNPAGLLARALHMWDPSSFSGTLQNQAYGYLWPMGPFFWLGDMSGLPIWAVQRLWWALLLCLAFLGMVRLIRVMGMGGPAVRVVAGLTYALTPMLLSKLGPISSEALPIALAPWMLIPLVCGAQYGSTRRWAALSGIAILCMGGVNAVATAAVLPLGLIWILTRERSRRMWTLLGWWALSVTLACLWWAIPLLLLGKYSPPFLDWIESASITTIASDPLSVTRGTSDWIAHLSEGLSPVWWLGWLLVTNKLAVLATAVIAGLGIVGLSLKTLPHRSFIVLTALLGFILLSLGHDAGVAGLGFDQWRSLFDGALSPLRNLHKFDPVLRVPLTLALAWLLTRSLQRVVTVQPGRHADAKRWVLRAGPMVAVGMSLVILVGAVATGPITKNRTYVDIPGFWGQAANWLQEDGRTGKALVMPGASFAQFIWGRTQDEPFQTLGGVEWDVRDAVPLGNAGHTRLLDAIAAQTGDGIGSKGLSVALQRSGFEWIVVRNDIDQRTINPLALVRLHNALSQTPNVTRVATFGPDVGKVARGDYFPGFGLESSYPAVEIFKVGNATDSKPAVVRDASHPLVLAGGAEALLSTAQAGVVTDGAVTMSGDPGTQFLPGMAIGTDTDRLREVNFGASSNNASNTMTLDEDFTLQRGTHDFRDRGRSPTTVAELEGVKSVTASSSAAYANSIFRRDAGAQPFAALDGDPETAWLTGTLGSPVDQWWRVDFEKPRLVKNVTVDIYRSASSVSPTSISVATNNAIADVDVTGKDRVVVPMNDPNAEFVKVTLTGVRDGDGSAVFGLSEVKVDGLAVARPLRINSATPVEGAVLAAAAGEASECLESAGRLRCTTEAARYGGERAGIDRWVKFAAGRYRFSVGVVPKRGVAIDRILTPPRSVVATVSSQDVKAAAGGGQVVSDGLETTTWLASRLDKQPTITLTLPEPRVITGVRLVLPFDVAAARPYQVEVTANGRSTSGLLDTNSTLAIPPTKTQKVVVKVLKWSRVATLVDGVIVPLPVGISELQLYGGQDLQRRLPDAYESGTACGFGPTVRIDGQEVTTGGAATVYQLMHGNSQQFAGCGRGSVKDLKEGWHRIQASPSTEFLANSVSVLPAAGLPAVTPAVSPNVTQWDATHRSVDVAASSERRTLETYESYNSGWTATLNGEPLDALQVDGWRQAWVVPAGAAGVVTMDFGPDNLYRLGLLLGLLAVIVLFALAFRQGRASTEPATGGRAMPRTAIVVAVVGALLVVGVGTLVAAACAGVTWFVLRRRRGATAVAVAVLFGVATLLEMFVGWQSAFSVPWLSALQASLVTAAVVVAVVGGSGGFAVFRRDRIRATNDGP